MTSAHDFPHVRVIAEGTVCYKVCVMGEGEGELSSELLTLQNVSGAIKETTLAVTCTILYKAVCEVGCCVGTFSSDSQILWNNTYSLE